MENTEMLIVQSKLKSFIKDKSQFSTSASYLEVLNQDIHQSIKDAIEHAKKNGRKTVMGRDFNLYLEDAKIDESLVVASKVKKLIKELSQMSTSAQAIDQLTVRVQQITAQAIEKTTKDKRKTVMDRDYALPSSIKEI
jgi:histone H3/H4